MYKCRMMRYRYLSTLEQAVNDALQSDREITASKDVQISIGDEDGNGYTACILYRCKQAKTGRETQKNGAK